MWSLLRKLRAKRKPGSLRSALADALTLQRRGEVRSDGLSSFSFSISLCVSWRARDVHPWDRDMPEDRKAPRLVEQTLHDTEDAIERIFLTFPEANTLEVNVLEKDPASAGVIVSGIVLRSELGRCSSTSIGMRLKMLGINYRLANEHFEPLMIRPAELQPADRVARGVGFNSTMSDLERGLPALAAKSRNQRAGEERLPN
jgi:hypothetical protein